MDRSLVGLQSDTTVHALKDEKQLLLWTPVTSIVSLDPFTFLQAGQFSSELTLGCFVSDSQLYAISAAKILFSWLS